MNTKPRTRREFLAQVGQGTLVATVGYEVASGLGLTPAFAADAPETLTFGALEPLVRLMQETPGRQAAAGAGGQAAHRHRTAHAGRRRRAGECAHVRRRGLRRLSHHDGASRPPFHMAQEMPAAQQALPVFKVLYRNTNRIQDHGGRKSEVLHPVQPAPLPAGRRRGRRRCGRRCAGRI